MYSDLTLISPSVHVHRSKQSVKRLEYVRTSIAHPAVPGLALATPGSADEVSVSRERETKYKLDAYPSIHSTSLKLRRTLGMSDDVNCSIARSFHENASEFQQSCTKVAAKKKGLGSKP